MRAEGPTAVFRPDGRTAAAAGSGKTVTLRDTTDPTAVPCEISLGHAGAVYRIAFSADGRTLVSGGADQAVRHCAAATEGACRLRSGD